MRSGRGMLRPWCVIVCHAAVAVVVVDAGLRSGGDGGGVVVAGHCVAETCSDVAGGSGLLARQPEQPGKYNLLILYSTRVSNFII